MKANKKESRAGRGVHRRDPAGNKGKPARTHARRENQVLYAAGRNSVLGWSKKWLSNTVGINVFSN